MEIVGVGDSQSFPVCDRGKLGIRNEELGMIAAAHNSYSAATLIMI